MKLFGIGLFLGTNDGSGWLGLKDEEGLLLLLIDVVRGPTSELSTGKEEKVWRTRLGGLLFLWLD